MVALALNPIPRDSGDLYRYLSPIVESWMGVANKGVALLQTQVNDPSQYAGDFANLDTTGSPTRKALRATAGVHSLTVDGSGITISSITIPGATTVNSLVVTTSATIGTTLGVTGATTLSSTLSAGATTVTTLHATGAATLDTTLSTGGLYTANAGITVATGTLTAGTTNVGTLGAGATTLSSLSVTNNVVIGTTLSAGGTTVASLGVTNNVAIGTTLGVTGTSTLAAVNAGATSVTTLAASSTSTFTGAVTMVSTLTVGNATSVTTGAIRLPNAGLIVSEDTGGTDRALIGLDASNFLRVGDHVSGAAFATFGSPGSVYLLGGSNVVFQASSANAFAFFGSTPNTKQTITGVTTGTLAQLQTVVRNILSAWANHGVWTDTTT